MGKEDSYAETPPKRGYLVNAALLVDEKSNILKCNCFTSRYAEFVQLQVIWCLISSVQRVHPQMARVDSTSLQQNYLLSSRARCVLLVSYP
jgi:hypothetical protein